MNGERKELEADGQEALIPDRRMEAERRGETVKGQWDRGKFIYDERRDNYICPGGEELRRR